MEKQQKKTSQRLALALPSYTAVTHISGCLITLTASTVTYATKRATHSVAAVCQESVLNCTVSETLSYSQHVIHCSYILSIRSCSSYWLTFVAQPSGLVLRRTHELF